MSYDKHLEEQARAISAKSRDDWTDDDKATLKKWHSHMNEFYKKQEEFQEGIKQKSIDFVKSLSSSLLESGQNRSTDNISSSAAAKLIEGILEPIIPSKNEETFSCNMLALQWAVDSVFYTHFTNNIVKYIDYMFDYAPVGEENKYNYLDMDADIWVETNIENPNASVENDSENKDIYSRLILQNHGYYVYVYRHKSYCFNCYSIRREDYWSKKKHAVKYNDSRDNGYAGDFRISVLEEYNITKKRSDDLFYYAAKFKNACFYIVHAAEALKNAIENGELDKSE